MQITVSWVLLLLGLVHAQQSVYQQQLAAPEYGLRIQHENIQTTDPSDYNYSYDVRDEITGDRKSQEESRSGDSVRGRYSLVDADGSTRTVEYSVDAQSGFNAVVRRDGDQISVPNPNSRTIPHLNEYQSRRPSAPEAFRNRYQHERYNRLDTRTRLAQDASTGNVVDLHSGFGVAPHVLPTPVPRSQIENHQNLDNLHNGQGRTNAYETHEYQRNEDVQEILARSHYQTSHPIVQHQSTHHVEQHQTSHPINHHLSTAPIHFPGSHGAFGSRANLAYERYSIRPATHEDVRRPSPIFANSNNANRAESRTNDDTNNQNLAGYNNINAFNQHVQYPIQQEEIRGLITPAPINPTFGPQVSSNANYPNNAFNQRVQYPIQQEEIRGPTTPAPVNPTLRHQVAYHESNDSITAYHGQPEFFGARINQNNRPTIQPIETGHVSVHEDSIITDSVATPAPFVTTVYSDTVVTPVPELYQDIPRIPSSDHRNLEVTVNNVQSYLYPASTLPLNDNTPPHFFTGDDLAANNVSPLMNVHDFDVRSSLYNHLAASYFAEPIHHDAHLLK